MKKTNKAQGFSPQSLTHSADDNTLLAPSPPPLLGADGKENMNRLSGKQSHGWLWKMCDKFLHRQRRHDKCEHCGQRSDTCRANASSVADRKRYLCDGCRESSDNVKSKYHECCRNVSIVNQCWTDGNSTDLSPPFSRSRSARMRPVALESGYDTAASLDSSCSNGRLSPQPRCMCPGQCAVHPDCYPCQSGELSPSEVSSVKKNHMNAINKSDVFGRAVKPTNTHLRQIQHGPQTRVHTRQHPTPLPQKPALTSPTHQEPVLCKDTTSYDGYLEIRTPNSPNVKYVFRHREGWEGVENDEVHNDHRTPRGHSEKLKLCYRCHQFRCIAFQAPFGNGWLCEDCADDLI